LCDVAEFSHLKLAGLQEMLCNLFSLNKFPDVLLSLAVPIYKHQVAMTAVSGALT
jgi:hypothetical protein